MTDDIMFLLSLHFVYLHCLPSLHCLPLFIFVITMFYIVCFLFPSFIIVIISPFLKKTQQLLLIIIMIKIISKFNYYWNYNYNYTYYTIVLLVL